LTLEFHIAIIFKTDYADYKIDYTDSGIT